MCRFIKKLFRCCESEDFFSQIEYGKSPEEICGRRTRNCLEWYMRKAIFYKYLFYILSVINISLPLASSAIMALYERSDIGIILASITSLSAALLALFNARERWTTYRTAAENIKGQYSLYCGRVGPYEFVDCHSQYLSRLEQYMTDVHTHWCDMQIESAKKEKQN